MAREISLANGKGSALVDDEDYELVSQYRWQLDNAGYAKRGWGENGRIYIERMHRLIMGAPPFEGAQVDHINGDRLDNRRINLRWATRRQNLGNSRRPSNNTSGYKGVSWDEARGMWRADITTSIGRRKFLGYFGTPEKAASAYDGAAIDCFGEFAKTNYALVEKEEGI